MSETTTSNTAPVGYDPGAPHRAPRQVGPLWVVGNDSRARVVKIGVGVSQPLFVHQEDNARGCPGGLPASAFHRCVEWAQGHRDEIHEAGFFG